MKVSIVESAAAFFLLAIGIIVFYQSLLWSSKQSVVSFLVFMVSVSISVLLGAGILGMKIYIERFEKTGKLSVQKILVLSLLFTFIVVAPIGLTIGFRYFRSKPIQDNAFWEAVNLACNGIGIHNAKSYTDEPGIHAISPKNMYGSADLYSVMPYSWFPKSIEDLELVACITDEHYDLVQHCQYEGGLLAFRYQHKISAFLVQARTGEILATTEFFGGLPQKCPRALSWDPTKGFSKNEFYGPNVKIKEILEWIEIYVVK